MAFQIENKPVTDLLAIHGEKLEPIAFTVTPQRHQLLTLNDLERWKTFMYLGLLKYFWPDAGNLTVQNLGEVVTHDLIGDKVLQATKVSYEHKINSVVDASLGAIDKAHCEVLGNSRSSLWGVNLDASIIRGYFDGLVEQVKNNVDASLAAELIMALVRLHMKGVSEYNTFKTVMTMEDLAKTIGLKTYQTGDSIVKIMTGLAPGTLLDTALNDALYGTVIDKQFIARSEELEKKS